MRAAASLLFASAYLVALLLAPGYDAASLPHGLRLLFTACGLSLFTSFLAFALSFRRPTPRPLTAPGDDLPRPPPRPRPPLSPVPAPPRPSRPGCPAWR